MTPFYDLFLWLIFMTHFYASFLEIKNDGHGGLDASAYHEGGPVDDIGIALRK